MKKKLSNFKKKIYKKISKKKKNLPSRNQKSNIQVKDWMKVKSRQIVKKER